MPQSCTTDDSCPFASLHKNLNKRVIDPSHEVLDVLANTLEKRQQVRAGRAVRIIGGRRLAREGRERGESNGRTSTEAESQRTMKRPSLQGKCTRHGEYSQGRGGPGDWRTKEVLVAPEMQRETM
jgi:hypothetical protein